MAFINKQDTDGTKATLLKGELGYDNYISGGDAGRVYVGNGSTNIALAKKSEADLKLALAGGTMTGATFLTEVVKGTVGTGTVTFTVSAGEVQKLTVSGALTIATTGWGTSGTFSQLLIELVNGGSATLTYPTINWIKPDGTKTTTVSEYLTAIARPALQTSGTDFIYLWSINAGTTIYGKML